LARAEVERRQAVQRIASLRLDTAEAVRRAARQGERTAERGEAARAGATFAGARHKDEERPPDAGLSHPVPGTHAHRAMRHAQVNLLQTTLDHQSALVLFEAVQQAPPPGSNAEIGIRGADIVLMPTPTPRGLFRTGAGQ